MKTFEDLGFDSHPNSMGGVQARMDFPNGYGVSVIRSSFSYGGNEGLYELAVMDGGVLCYDTPVTNDVVGHCSEEKISQLMKEVQGLPSKELIKS